jgi:hypothetical protein
MTNVLQFPNIYNRRERDEYADLRLFLEDSIVALYSTERILLQDVQCCDSELTMQCLYHLIDYKKDLLAKLPS